MLTSLETSFPDWSGFVQKTPLALLPFIDSGSPGICVNEIAPKLVTPASSNFFVFTISLYVYCNLAMSNFKSCLWKSLKLSVICCFNILYAT